MQWLRGVIVGVALSLTGGVAAPVVLAQAVDASQVWSGNAVLVELAKQKGDKIQSFEGTVEWKAGLDAAGRQTLIGAANFPAQTLVVNLVIGLNPDQSVPASHVIDIGFQLGANAEGDKVDKLIAVAFKSNVKGQGRQLAGASVKLADNSFLFALSNADADLKRNMTLLGDRDFIDIPVVFASGKRAVLTLGLGGARAAFAAFAAASLQ